MIRHILFLLCLLPSISFAAPAIVPVSAPVTISLHEVKLSDLAHVVYGDLLKRSYIFDSDVIHSPDDISINWQNLSAARVEQLTREVFVSRGFDLVQAGDVLMLHKVKKEEEEVLIYQPRFRSSRYLSDLLFNVAAARPLGARGLPASPQFQASIAQQPETAGTASAMVDKSALDQLAFNCTASECVKLRRLLAQLDTPEANVILRAVIYEVSTTKGDGSALQVAALLFKGKFAVAAGSIVPGAATLTLTSGGLDVVASFLDADSRFNSLSRPSLRVKTGANARFSVGQQVPVLGAISQDKNGNPLQSIDYRQSGTIFTVQPDIRGDVIDLNVTQELSSFAVTSTGVNNSPTLMQRTATSTLSLKDGEVVVFAGLEENKGDAASASFFGFPLSRKTSATRSEVLLFIEAQRI